MTLEEQIDRRLADGYNGANIVLARELAEGSELSVRTIRLLISKRKAEFNSWRETAEDNGVRPESVNGGWLKTKKYSLRFKNVVDYEKIRKDLIKDMVDYTPVYPVIEREYDGRGNLLVIDPADIHMGKKSSKFETREEISNDSIKRDVLEGVRGILTKSRGFEIDKVLFVGGNDILHTDNPFGKTTAGTNQDTDQMWYDNFSDAKKLYVEVLEMLISLADVHYIHCPSNHDFMAGFMLSDAVMSWFHKNDNITFDCDMTHRKYYKYGDNLLGFTHGDGAKVADLPLLMAQEAEADWEGTKRYFYTHHVHHKSGKDFGSVSVESLRTPTGADGWHSRNGYQHSPRAVEGFIHDKDNGQVCRLSHFF